MKCAAVNKELRRKKLYDTGMTVALSRLSLYLDSVLSDKLRYSNTRIKQIHSSFNKVAADVQEGRRSMGELMSFLQAEYGVELDMEHRIRPAWFKSDYVGGVYAAEDALTVVLIYVLMHQYKFSNEKCNRVLKGINELAASVNTGYVTEADIRQCLQEEEGLVSEKLEGVRK